MNKPEFITKKVEITPTYGKFVISPLPGGYGHSLGNALRRVLLSSIEGAAVTYIKINSVTHPFTTIEGIKESVLEMILNIKQLRFKTMGEGPYKMTLQIKGKGVVFAKDFKGGNVEVINKNLTIAEITNPKTNLDIDIYIELGKGYSPFEEKEKKSFGILPVDSIFSPITKASYFVEGERVGRKTNYDKLTVEVVTDGSVTPEQALKQASTTLSQFYSYVLSGKDDALKKQAEEDKAAKTTEIDEKVYETIIDELDLPTRVINALLREKIETVGDLVEKGRDHLVNLKGVGRKSIDLIDSELKKLNVSLGD